MLLVLIGPRWLDALRECAGRTDDSYDLVWATIATALRAGAWVIPVLVEDSPMPTADELPGSLQQLAFRQALILRGADDESIEQLVAAVDRAFSSDPIAGYGLPVAAEPSAATSFPPPPCEPAPAPHSEREQASQKRVPAWWLRRSLTERSSEASFRLGYRSGLHQARNAMKVRLVLWRPCRNPRRLGRRAHRPSGTLKLPRRRGRVCLGGGRDWCSVSVRARPLWCCCMSSRGRCSAVSRSRLDPVSNRRPRTRVISSIAPCSRHRRSGRESLS